jgi:ribosomal protein S18 acetylase RimI-like enzyme
LGKKVDDKDTGDYAELLSIGILPSYSGLGIGKGLINRFEEVAIDSGCTSMALTTDFNDNDKVLAFYKSTGYKIYSEFITYPNRKMLKFIKQLKKQ